LDHTIQIRLNGAERALNVQTHDTLLEVLRDNLGFFERSEQVELLARQVPDSAGIYIVPAFSGLFAPYWQSDAAG
jgi:glycerol kinase